MKEIDESILIKKIRGKCTLEEERQIGEWLADSEENKKAFAQMKIIWNAGKVQQYATEKALQVPISKINERIDKIQAKSKSLKIRNLLKYAALFAGLIGVLITCLVMQPFSGKTMLITKEVGRLGGIESVQLVDGTRVWLNNGSTLIYPERFNKRNRTVKVSGEAFFEVAKDPSHPFLVETPAACIGVTGTSFNVNTNAKGKVFQTVLISGSVDLLDSSGQRIASLLPGQMASMETARSKVDIMEVDTEVYTAWQDGKVIFEKASLVEILTKIQEVYLLKLQYDSVTLNRNIDRYNFVFLRSQPADTVLEMLKFVAPLDSLKVILPKQKSHN